MDGSSTSGNPVFDLVVVTLLILVGGFFAASEIALITAKRHRLQQLAEDGDGGVWAKVRWSAPDGSTRTGRAEVDTGAKAGSAATVWNDSEGRLARFKQPKRVMVVSELPRNTMGKVQKNVLRETHKQLYAKKAG